MKIKTNKIRLSIIVFFSMFITYSSIYAQPKSQESPDSQEQQVTGDANTLTTLKGTIEVVLELEEQLRSKKAELKATQAQEQKLKIKEEIATLNERLVPLKKDFEEIATGINLESFDAKPQKQFDWKQELQTLLGPLIEEIKNLTEQPREIERLHSEIAYYGKKTAFAKDALDNLHKLISLTKDEKLKNSLVEVEKNWIDKEKNISNQLLISEYQLAEKTKEKKSFLESGHDIVRIFFKSRGRNFILSALAFIFVFVVLRILYRYIYKISPTLRSVKRAYYIRVIDIIYHIMTFVGATGAMLVVLYTAGDWVILGLVFILLVGLAWTAKNTLPRFWEQTKLLLNLGTVRENERVVFNGIPWRVVTLNIYTYLVNPELKGGMIRFPLKELTEIRSRPFHHDEPWFPCSENDIVMLADETCGKVILQTPEVVQLELAAGCVKTYITEDFLKQNPKNISRGFRISITFGIDYQYQTISTREIPEIFRKSIYAGLLQEGRGDYMKSFGVEFKEAGDSSLDYLIMADFSGQAAKDYFTLNRTIQRLALETCNKHNWEIPFNQIVVHTAPAKG